MIPYIINVALILAACLAFYKILLQKETFYKINRYVLLVCLLISFGLPLIPVPQQWSFRKIEAPVAANSSTSIPVQQAETPLRVQPETKPATSQTTTSNSLSIQKTITWLYWLYWFGVLAFAVNFLVQLIALLHRIYSNPFIQDGRYRIVEVSGDKAPCSFGNTIFINPEKYDWETYEQILQHEKLHVQQVHSLDILFAELVLIFQWFNPFAWWYRKEIEANLEFLTDDQMVQKHAVERSGYQLSLLKVSTPHFPLSLTTNYNQSLLKKRIVMLNSKRSNLHTAWKYFFLVPLLVLFACAFNNPVAYSQEKETQSAKRSINHGIETEGSWFATIKDDKINFQFKRDGDDESSFNGSTFSLSEFSNLPKGAAGNFKLTREAGTMEFNGKFEGNQGMGHYKFVGDKQYGEHMNSQLSEKLDERDLMVFFFIDIKKSYVQMLKDQGYGHIEKNDVIPLAALKVDKDFISSVKSNGYKDASLQDLIPLKSLGIDGAYIKEIKGAGYPNISIHELISFKSQGIDKNYLNKVQISRARQTSNETGKGKNNPGDDNRDDVMDPNNVVALKALHVDEEYINSFKAVGFNNISHSDLIAMKSLDITPEYAKTFQAIGYKDISPSDLIPLKSQNVTPEFIKSFESVGFKEIQIHDVIAVKSLHITPEYIKSMREKGFNYNSLNKYITLKSIDN